MGDAQDTPDRIREWLTDRISEYLELPADEVDPWENLTHYGIDSMHRAELSTALEKKFGIAVRNDLIRDSETIDEITDVVHGELKERAPR